MSKFNDLHFREIIGKRQQKLQLFREEPELLNAAWAHYKYHKEGAIDFISDWIWTHDPKRNLGMIPLVLYPKQAELVLWVNDLLDKRESGVIEKTREVGATWVLSANSVYLWLFRDSLKVGWGSRKEMLVDRLGDPDSIFEKFRIMLRMLPIEFLPSVRTKSGQKFYEESTDATHLRLINRENGSVITGESGDQIGRGGRSNIFFKDESAFYNRPDKIESALSENCDVQIDISTPNGVGNPFYRKVMSGNYSKFTFHWRDDPRKDDAWYKKRCEQLDPEIVARELDIDYGASMGGVMIQTDWINAAVDAHTKLGFAPRGKKMLGLDVADSLYGDTNGMAIVQGNILQSIEEFREKDTSVTSRRAWSTAQSQGIDVIKYDVIGVGSGVKGEFNNLTETTTAKISIVAVNSAHAVKDGWYVLATDTDKGIKNKDMFLNYRAQLWWNVRRRFEKTYQTVMGTKQWPVEELISIMYDRQLMLELGQPLRQYTSTGLLKVESKEDMRARSVKSGNKADALVLAFAELSVRKAGTF